MDSITQAALGAAVGGAILGRRLGRKAVILGAVMGTLPDLDVALDYGDAIASVTEHRGFSHSLLVLTGIATLLAVLSRRFWLSTISLARWWAFFTLTLITHPLLDSLTTYGTQLLWPLPSPPLAWPIIFIIDPLYTLPMLICVLTGLASRRVVRACTLGLALSSTYLLLAAGAKWSIEQRLTPTLADLRLEQAPLLVQPTPFNILLWRVTVIDGERYYESLISLLDDHQPPPSLEPFKRNAQLEKSALASGKGQRLRWFTGPFLRYQRQVIDGQETLVATDLRLGFPGYHPFSFTLATREDGHWQPVNDSQQVSAERGLDLEALSRLASRAGGDRTALCASDFVAPHWRQEAFRLRC